MVFLQCQTTRTPSLANPRVQMTPPWNLSSEPLHTAGLYDVSSFLSYQMLLPFISLFFSWFSLILFITGNCLCAICYTLFLPMILFNIDSFRIDGIHIYIIPFIQLICFWRIHFLLLYVGFLIHTWHKYCLFISCHSLVAPILCVDLAYCTHQP